MKPFALGLAALLLCATAAAGQPVMEPHPLGPVPPDDPRMESYAHGNYALRVVDYLWTAGLLALVAFSGFSATLQRWAAVLTKRPGLQVGWYAVLLTFVMFAGTLPLAEQLAPRLKSVQGFVLMGARADMPASLSLIHI